MLLRLTDERQMIAARRITVRYVEQPASTFCAREEPVLRQNRRHICRNCKQRKAIFCINGRWKADSKHELCTRCYRSVRDRVISAQIHPIVYDPASFPRAERR